jgi:hypothetical protein
MQWQNGKILSKKIPIFICMFPEGGTRLPARRFFYSKHACNQKDTKSISIKAIFSKKIGKSA